MFQARAYPQNYKWKVFLSFIYFFCYKNFLRRFSGDFVRETDEYDWRSKESRPRVTIELISFATTDVASLIIGEYDDCWSRMRGGKLPRNAGPPQFRLGGNGGKILKYLFFN